MTRPRGPGTQAVHGRHGARSGPLAPPIATAGIEPGLVRLSIGVEDEADLVADLEQALAG